jgi:amidase
VQGSVTGFGSPDWARSHAPAAAHAHAVQALLAAGARATCKTVMDELAYRQAHHRLEANACMAAAAVACQRMRVRVCTCACV